MTNKPQFVGETRRKIRLNELCTKGKSSLRQKDISNGGPYAVYGASGIVGYMDSFQNAVPYVAVVKDGAGVGRTSACAANTSVLGTMQALIPTDGTDRDYLLHLIKSLRLGDDFSGSTIPHIYFKDYGKTLVPFHNPVEQQRIVDILSTVERQIEGSKQQLDQLDNLVKSRFVEMFGVTPEESRFPVLTVGAIADVIVGVVVKPKRYYTEDFASGVKAFRSLNVREMRIHNDEWVYFTREGNEECEKSKLKVGDVLVVRSGYPGTSCVVTEEFEGCNAVDLIIARPDQNVMNPNYLAAFTNSDYVKGLIGQASVGSAQKHFNVGAYKKMKIAVPPLADQTVFVDFLQQVDKSRFVAQQQIEKLQMLYDSLAQEYFGD